MEKELESLGALLRKSAPLSALGSDDAAPLSQQEREQEKCDLYNGSEGDLHLADGYECKRCKNKGYIAVVTQNELYGYYSETLTHCKCMKVRSAIRKMKASGLKNVAADFRFDKYETPEPWQQHIKQTAMRFCEDEKNHWFFIGGQSGAGKTHICAAITFHYLRQGIAARYMLWRDEVVKIKALVNEPAEYGKLMDELKTAPVLYIDDLFKVGESHDGNARPTVGDINAAFEIINYRANNPGLTTIISSERTMMELLAIDEATAGRIAKPAKDGGYMINLKKDSKRNWRLRGMEEI